MSLRVCLCVCWLDKEFPPTYMTRHLPGVAQRHFTIFLSKGKQKVSYQKHKSASMLLRIVQGQAGRQQLKLSLASLKMIFMVRRASRTRDPQFGQLLLRWYLSKMPSSFSWAASDYPSLTCRGVLLQPSNSFGHLVATTTLFPTLLFSFFPSLAFTRSKFTTNTAYDFHLPQV